MITNDATSLSPLRDGFSIEFIYRPFVPDNITNWWVFNDENGILNFLTSEGSYSNQIIDEDEHDKQLNKSFEENSLPKHVVKFEDLLIWRIDSRKLLTVNSRVVP